MIKTNFRTLQTILLAIFLLCFGGVFAQQQKDTSKVGFTVNFNIGKVQCLKNEAISIFPNTFLRSENSATIDLFVGMYIANFGQVGIKYTDMSYKTLSEYNESIDMSSFLITSRLSKALPYNFETFFEAGIGGLFARNFYTIDKINGTAKRIGFCASIDVGIVYCVKKYTVGINGGIFCSNLAKTKENLSVPTTTDCFTSINGNIGLCFGIRL